MDQAHQQLLPQAAQVVEVLEAHLVHLLALEQREIHLLLLLHKVTLVELITKWLQEILQITLEQVVEDQGQQHLMHQQVQVEMVGLA
tara:strand:- start:223 stop:483 length:261 start_codon:yes stop_codon:yes gene_type:complete